jgi:serine/threonine protein phosphatase 1
MNFTQVHPPEKGRRIAIGDIHGCFDTFQHLLEDRLRINKDDQVFILGDFIGRGKNTQKVLDYLIEMLGFDFNIHLIKGNHEEKLIIAHDCGFEFFERYLESDQLVSLLGEKLYTYLRLCYEAHDCIHIGGHTYLNHKGLTPTLEQHLNSNNTISDYRIIHGHLAQTLTQIQTQIKNQEKAISIDAGCVYPQIKGMGYLCALDLDSHELYFEQNREL